MELGKNAKILEMQQFSDAVIVPMCSSFMCKRLDIVLVALWQSCLRELVQSRRTVALHYSG